MRMQTNLPARKVNAATVGAAVAEIATWLAGVLVPNVTVPDSVESAITIVLVFLFGYFTPPADRDQIVPATP